VSFINKYRPNTWEEVRGQDAACTALENALNKKRAQCFMLVGPSGVGKTTIARIAAKSAGIPPRSIHEVNAARNTGVEEMRKVCEVMALRPIGDSTGRAAIIDEAHRLSAQAFDSILKDTEEPRDGFLWFMCTTNPAKIPKTVRTRFMQITLKEVNAKVLDDLVYDVVKAEDLRTPDSVLKVVVDHAGGSPRQALSLLAACAEARDKQEAMSLIAGVEDADAVLQFCRFVVKPGTWAAAMELLEKMKGESPEGVRIQVMNYLGAVIKNQTNEKAARGMLPLLEAFATPYTTGEGFAPLMLSLGRCMWVIK
jgi:DNA polymerase III subunit gamma/tau